MTTVDSRADFIDLVCADDDLLRAEFEEIVAAGWGPPPGPAPDRSGGRGPGPAGPPAVGVRPPRPTRPGVNPDLRARQRGPPR